MDIVPKTKQAKNIAFLYHDDDTGWKEKLCKHLTLMRRQGLISIIESSNTMPHLDIILLLTSPSFFGDDKLINAVDYAIAHREEDQRIISILVRDVSLGEHRLKNIQGLPRNGKALEEWSSKDKGLAQIAEEIRAIVKREG